MTDARTPRRRRALLLERLRAMGGDERGGVHLVLAFAVIGVTLMAGLASASMMNSSVSLSQRITQAAHASVRGALDSVLAAVNQGAATKDPAQIAATFVCADPAATCPHAFPLVADGAVAGETRVTAATYNGSEITLTLVTNSTGRVEWERAANATLTLARATSLARIEDGRAVWDYAAPTGDGSYAEHVVALWTPGDIKVYVPGTGGELATPNQPQIHTNLDERGTAMFAATYAGGCDPGTTAEIQTRWRVGASSSWSAWSGSETAQGALEAGQQASFQARVRCHDGDRISNWSSREVSLTRASEVYEAPVPTVTLQGNGQVEVRAAVPAEVPETATASLQLRMRQGSTWGDWMAATSFYASVPAGQTIEVQSRLRVVTDSGDTGWVESAPASFSR